MVEMVFAPARVHTNVSKISFVAKMAGGRRCEQSFISMIHMLYKINNGLHLQTIHSRRRFISDFIARAQNVAGWGCVSLVFI